MHPRLFATLVATLTWSCGGKTLDVDHDPHSGGGSGGRAGHSGGSSGNTGGGASSAGGDANSPGSGGDWGEVSGPAYRPCDVFGGEGHPCVAAHSTVRLLRSAYDGPLYQVCKGPTEPGPGSCHGEAKDIFADGDGYAQAQVQDEFCDGATCTITIVYDQSGSDNHLEPSLPGSNNPGPGKPVAADALPVTAAGHAVYGMVFALGTGYRAACDGCRFPEDGQPTVPTGDEPETIYMVTSQLDTNNGCCFDYGNAETTSANDGNGSIEAVYIGGGVVWGIGAGDGPWVMADLENGLYPGWDPITGWNYDGNESTNFDFVTAVLVGDTQDKNDGKGRFALYAGNTQSGTLETKYDGIRPDKPGYVPMIKQGSVVLGIAGDASSLGTGRFYEGAITRGAASTATLDTVQAALVAARYGR